MVGVALDALKDGQREEKTVSVLLSDHGFHLGENEHWRKRTLWEEATRVLLMIRVSLLHDPGRPWKPAITSHLPGNRTLTAVVATGPPQPHCGHRTTPWHGEDA